MAKRKIPEDGQTELASAKRRRKSIISDEHKNPSDADGIAECFKYVTVKMNVAVAPKFSFAMLDGVREQHLDPLIMNYYTAAKGVVIAHSDVKLLGQDARGTGRPAAKIIADSPFGWIWIEAKLLTWSPAKGDLIEGWISVQSPGHIALLVHDTFNATIRRDDIPSSWSFVPCEDDEKVDSKSLGYWTDSTGNRIDGKLAFTVKVFNYSGRTVLVQGTLLTRDDVKLPSAPGPTPSPVAAAPSKHKKFGEDEPPARLPEAIQDDDMDDVVVPVEANTSDEEEDSE